MTFRSRTQEPSALPRIIFGICLTGLCIAVALAYANGISLPHIVATMSPPAAPAAAPAPAPIFPCELPVEEGARSSAMVELREGVLYLTCNNIRPLLRPIAPKGAK